MEKGTEYLLDFTLILLHENNRWSSLHIMILIENLMSFPKIYDLRGTNLGIDVFPFLGIDAELFCRVDPTKL